MAQVGKRTLAARASWKVARVQAVDAEAQERRDALQNAIDSGSPHEILSHLFGFNTSRLSDAEAKGQLGSTMRALRRLQRGVKRWLVAAELRRTSYKVTTRSHLEFSSQAPPDPQLEAQRRIRVTQHGWRAPLNKRYTPLGQPILDVKKKPEVEAPKMQSQQQEERSAAERQQQRHVFINHGEARRGAIHKFGYTYFQTFMSDTRAHLLVTVDAHEGDPDLFMSRDVPYPDAIEFTWSSSGLGSDTIEVLPTDPNFGLGPYYIAVYGGGGASSCEFTITVTSKRPLGGRANTFRTYSFSEAAKHEGRFAIERRRSDERRMKVKFGQNASALMAADANDSEMGISPAQTLLALHELPRIGPVNPSAELVSLERLYKGATIQKRLAFALHPPTGQPAQPPAPGLQPGMNVEWVCNVLAKIASFVTIGVGEVAVRAGEPAAFIALILKGEVVSELRSTDAAPRKTYGKAEKKLVFSEADVFGEDALLAKGARRPHTLVAHGGPCELLVLSYAALAALGVQGGEDEAFSGILRLIGVCSTTEETLSAAADEVASREETNAAKKKAQLRQAQTRMENLANTFEQRLQDHEFHLAMAEVNAMPPTNERRGSDGARYTALEQLCDTSAPWMPPRLAIHGDGTPLNPAAVEAGRLEAESPLVPVSRHPWLEGPANDSLAAHKRSSTLGSHHGGASPTAAQRAGPRALGGSLARPSASASGGAHPRELSLRVGLSGMSVSASMPSLANKTGRERKRQAIARPFSAGVGGPSPAAAANAATPAAIFFARRDAKMRLERERHAEHRDRAARSSLAAAQDGSAADAAALSRRKCSSASLGNLVASDGDSTYDETTDSDAAPCSPAALDASASSGFGEPLSPAALGRDVSVARSAMLARASRASSAASRRPGSLAIKARCQTEHDLLRPGSAIRSSASATSLAPRSATDRPATAPSHGGHSRRPPRPATAPTTRASTREMSAMGSRPLLSASPPRELPMEVLAAKHKDRRAELISGSQSGGAREQGGSPPGSPRKRSPKSNEKTRGSAEQKARVALRVGDFAQMRRERGRQLHSDLDTIRDARLDSFKLRYAAFDASTILASNANSRQAMKVMRLNALQAAQRLGGDL